MFDLPLVVSGQVLHGDLHLLDLLLHVGVLLILLLLNKFDLGVLLSKSFLEESAFLGQLVGELVFKLAL